jgi:dihydrofolate reductase
MGKLIYSSICSLDGYVNDARGKFDWSIPDEQVHRVVNDFMRPVGTYIFGRRMYEVLAAWESMDVTGHPDYIAEFADIWSTADKLVISTTLDGVTTKRTSLERSFDPEAIAQLKQGDKDVTIGGPTLAAHAIRAGLVDEFHLFVSPVIVGGGTHFLPRDIRIDLELVEERTFGNGVVFTRYAA